MPSRKQRQRKLKSKRHEWETVWVDDAGNELEAPPEDVVEREKQDRTATKAAASQNGGKKQPAQRGLRREAQPPSWARAIKRAGLLGIVVYFLFTFAAGSSSNRYVSALVPAVIYTGLFVPFTYLLDRFAYRRYQAKQGSGGGAATPRPAKKR
jgi:hypothetical protein